MKKVLFCVTGEVTIFNDTICCPPWSRTTIHAVKERCPAFRRGGIMSGRQDSNLQPQAPKACILPIEILPEVFVETVGLEPTSSDFQSVALTIFATFPFVGLLGFEPRTPVLKGRCSTELSHKPNCGIDRIRTY